MSRILVVEDESAIAELISINLRHAGFEVTLAASATQAQYEVDRVLPDLVVLDWMLPGQSGVALARQWRGAARTKELPIIMLTARAEEGDKIAGLDAGADDYVTKPFSTNELLARIRAVLRRAGTGGRPEPAARPAGYRFEGWRLDLARRNLISPDGLALPLSGGELDLLVAFLERPGTVLSRDQLLDLARGRAALPFDRSIDIQVSRLRRKLGDDPKAPGLIRTVRAGGYVFAGQVEAVGAESPPLDPPP